MTAYLEYRLFRNDPRIRFAGAMHESILPGIHRACAEDGTKIADLHDVILTHWGFEGDLSAKHARNLPLLAAEIETDPTRVYLRFHLGYTLSELKRFDEAAEQWTQGIALAADPAADPQSRVEGSLCASSLGQILLEQDRASDALEVVENGLALYPENLALQIMQARCFFLLGRMQEARQIAMRFADSDVDAVFDPKLAYPKELLGVTRFALLGDIHLKSGDYGQAAAFFDKAAEAASEPQVYRTKASLARARAQGARPAFRT